MEKENIMTDIIDKALLDYLMAYYNTSITTRPVLLLNSKMAEIIKNKLSYDNNQIMYLDKIEVLIANHLGDFEVDVH